MKNMILAALLALPTNLLAQTALETWTEDRTTVLDASDVSLEDFKWQARAVIVFAESPQDPQFQRQLDLLNERIEDLAERDIVIITDTTTDPRSDIRTRLRPRAFMMALVGKDGEIKLRKPAPWTVRELSRSIDKMPLRQQEIRDRRTP